MAITHRVVQTPDGKTLFHQIDDSEWGSIVELVPDDDIKKLPSGIYDENMKLIALEPIPEDAQ